MSHFPRHPKHPERICWGCARYCPAHDLACGNGTDRTQHPAELFGDDWYEWTSEYAETTSTVAQSESRATDEWNTSVRDASLVPAERLLARVRKREPGDSR